MHSILYWINKDDPRGPRPTNPQGDGQFSLWETPVRAWALEHGYTDGNTSIIPTVTDTAHTAPNRPLITFDLPSPNITYSRTSRIAITLRVKSTYPFARAMFFFNNVYLGSSQNAAAPSLSFIPDQIGVAADTNTIRVTVEDTVGNKSEAHMELLLSDR
ncbi:MAG: hypothetical protein A2542_00870 [Parcubacteria group bacterium RIFOXYD2_FULL_52_8]|nr:MAG: hypothetical protein A2542_00870 [Parcubacteria group bacterium RIFOXYD2_FULL_52_8]